MNRDALKRELTEQFQQSLDQAMEAVERAPDGRWIPDYDSGLKNRTNRLNYRGLTRSIPVSILACGGCSAGRGESLEKWLPKIGYRSRT